MNNSVDPTFHKCSIAPWQPPKQVFIVVWIILYVFYGIILYKSRKSNAINSLWLGLALNLSWAPLFVFNSKVGFAIIILMILVAFDSYNKLLAENLKDEAKFLQVYLAWLFFALTLNGYIAIKCKT